MATTSRPSLVDCFKHLASYQPVISVSDIPTASGPLTVAHEIRRCALWCGYTVHTKTYTADHGICTRTRKQIINILRDAHTRNLA